MSKICYIARRFYPKTRKLIEEADAILSENYDAGYRLTLRQLYYQFVALDRIPNTIKSYNRLKETISFARLAGLLDWDHMVDRTRNLEGWAFWDSTEELLEENANVYTVDKWEDQKYRLEVWVEKDALADVVMQAVRPWQVPYFSCRGYTSTSSLWEAGNRLADYESEGKTPVVIHLGDHDPSGIDMTRDITDRCALFMGGVDVQRIALSLEQVRRFRLPPNPTKVADSRSPLYIARHGLKSWELDALKPDYIKRIIEAKIQEYIDPKLWAAANKREVIGKAYFERLAERGEDETDL